jgi:hypothetical protein
MLADLDLLLTMVFYVADNLLPAGRPNARRRLSDSEVVTLLIAQAIMGVTSDRRFVKVARKRLVHLFPGLIGQSGLHKRRAHLAAALEQVMTALAQECPGYWDELVLLDSTPVECARSRETVKRGGQSSLADALTDAADYGYCASHSRHFFGFRLHALFAPDGTPRALALTSPKIDEKLVCLQMVARCERQPGQALILIGDKNFRGKDFETELATLEATIMRPRRKDEQGHGPHLAPIRQRIESIFQTCKDILTLERHGARTLANLRVRLCARFAALAAAVMLNHQLGRPARSLAPYTA